MVRLDPYLVTVVGFSKETRGDVGDGYGGVVSGRWDRNRW